MQTLRTVWWAWALALGAALVPDAWAARLVRVYDVTVPVSGAASFGDAMRVALVRATGDREAERDPNLQALITDARRYAQVVRPVAGGGTQVSFDASAVDRALVAAGRSLWPRERPVLLLVLDVPADSAEATTLRAAAEEVATARGLPLVVLPMTVAGGPFLSREAALAAARRNGADHVLSVASGGAGQALRFWSAETQLSQPLSDTGAGDLADAMHRLADALAANSIGLSVQPELETEIQVSGVASLRDYADIARSLAAVAGVRAVNLLELAPGVATWRVVVRGGDETLRAALAADARFNPAAGSVGRLGYAFQR